MAQSIRSVISAAERRFLMTLSGEMTVSRENAAEMLECDEQDVDAHIERLSALLGIEIACMAIGWVH